MPIILEDENSRFGGRQLILPYDLVKHLKQKQVQYSGDSYKTSRGYKRLNALLNNGYNKQSDRKERLNNDKYSISFSDVKRILHDINSGMDSDEYDMIGGRKMFDFVQNTLKSLRNSVQKVKPVPEVPKLSAKDIEPEKPKNVVKAGNVEVTLEDREFAEDISKIF